VALRRGESHHGGVLVGAESPPQKAVGGCAPCVIRMELERLWRARRNMLATSITSLWDIEEWHRILPIGGHPPCQEPRWARPGLLERAHAASWETLGKVTYPARNPGGQGLDCWREPMRHHGRLWGTLPTLPETQVDKAWIAGESPCGIMGDSGEVYTSNSQLARALFCILGDRWWLLALL
jgi:hypothetical protein